MPKHSTKVARVCGHCRQDFTFVVRPSEPKRGQFCGHRCADEHRKRPAETRFREMVGSPTDTGCTQWLGALNEAGGYGQFCVRTGVYEAAHRFAYRMKHGAIPDGLQVLHRCDNPPCVNPDHLFVGTAKDNSADAKSKGRLRVGEKHGGAKLTSRQVLEIRARLRSGASGRELATELGVSRRLVRKIANRTAWGHLADA